MAAAIGLAGKVRDFLETLQSHWETYRFYYNLGDNVNKIIENVVKPL